MIEKHLQIARKIREDLSEIFQGSNFKFQLAILSVIFFFLNVILPGRTASARGCFSAVPCHTQITIFPGLAAGWPAGARVRFLPKGQGNTAAAEDRSRASNLEPCNCQADAPTT